MTAITCQQDPQRTHDASAEGRRGNLLSRLLAALHRSRALESRRAIERHRHLVAEAREFDARGTQMNAPFTLTSLRERPRAKKSVHDGADASFAEVWRDASHSRGRMLRSWLAQRAGGPRSLDRTTASRVLSWSTVVIAAVGIGLVLSESALLSARGFHGAALALVAVLFAATVSSIAGFAFSALCGALLFHLMDSPVDVVQVMIVCSIAIQLLSVVALRRSIDWRSLPAFLVGGVFGVPAGVYLLVHLASGAYRDVIGCLLVIYGSYLLLRLPTRALQTGRLADVGAGFLGGLTGGLAGFPGAFVTIWCGMKGWDKARQRGVYQPFILGMQPVSLFVIHMMKPMSASAGPFDWQTLAFIPAALLGAWCGLNIFKGLSDRQFAIAVNALLIASGIGLVL
jgi:uncharacterized protein